MTYVINDLVVPSMPSFPKVVIGNLSLVVFAVYFCFFVVEVGNTI